MKENEIYIGRKPAINYVLAVQTQVNQKLQSIILRARGRNISKAVDVAQISLKNKYIKGFDVGKIKLDTEVQEIETKYGKKNRNVSTIEICLKRKKMRDGLE